jgi:toxin-antitoxin system PIN domain toxin
MAHQRGTTLRRPYGLDETPHHHRTARPFPADAMSSSETVGIPTAVAVGFARLTTNPRVMVEPLEPATSIEIVAGWLARPNVISPGPTRRHFAVLGELLAASGVAGNLVSDAHLAALAVEHGAELWSYDHDVARFPGLDWSSPGAS